MTSLLWALLALIAGISSTMQTATNSLLGQHVGLVYAALVSTAVTTAVLTGWVVVRMRAAVDLQLFQGVPLHLFFGGLFGGAFIMVMILLPPRIGVGPTALAAVCGQVLGSLLIDHFGVFGTRVLHVMPGQMVGALLVLLGTFLVVYYSEAYALG